MGHPLSRFVKQNATPAPWEDFYCPLFGFESQKFLSFLEARATLLHHVAQQRDQADKKCQQHFAQHKDSRSPQSGFKSQKPLAFLEARDTLSQKVVLKRDQTDKKCQQHFARRLPS
jgi:hypothetical protein